MILQFSRGDLALGIQQLFGNKSCLSILFRIFQVLFGSDLEAGLERKQTELLVTRKIVNMTKKFENTSGHQCLISLLWNQTGLSQQGINQPSSTFQQNKGAYHRHIFCYKTALHTAGPNFSICVKSIGTCFKCLFGKFLLWSFEKCQ